MKIETKAVREVMDVLTTLRVCARRWYVALPLIIVGAVAAVLYAGSQKPTWSVSQHLLVVAPSTANGVKPGTQAAVNPFGGGPNAARLASTGMASALQSQTVLDRLRDIGPSASYTAKAAKDQPAVDVVVTGPKRADVESRMRGLTYAAQLELHGIQVRAGAPAKQLLQVVPSLDGDPVPAQVPPSRTKGIVAISLLTLLAAGLGSIVAERVAGRRRAPESGAYPHDATAVVEDRQFLDLDAPSERAGVSG